MRMSSMLLTLLFIFGISSAATAEPTPEQLRQQIRDYIQHQEKMQGAFVVLDDRGGDLLRLELIRVHERVGKTGDYYYSCTDMKQIGTTNEFDLDFDVADTNGTLSVVAVRVHKENGKARYTYDDNDNMIPLT